MKSADLLPAHLDSSFDLVVPFRAKARKHFEKCTCGVRLGAPLLAVAGLAGASVLVWERPLGARSGQEKPQLSDNAPRTPTPPRPPGHSTAPPLSPQNSGPGRDSASRAQEDEGSDEVVEPPTKSRALKSEAAARCLMDAWLSHAGRKPQRSSLAILWAHWALETGRGVRMVGNNFAGIKGEGPRGDSIRLWTRERRGDHVERVRRSFRVYPSPSVGAHDYIDLLKGRYPSALRAARRGSVIDFVRALEAGGYFTEDPETYLRAMRSLYFEFMGTGSVGSRC